MKAFFRSILLTIQDEENKISLHPDSVVSEAVHMIELLDEKLEQLRIYVSKSEFDNADDEIDFFRNIKPYVFGRLLFYNKVYRIETSKPAEIGDYILKYLRRKLRKLESSYKHTANSDFYKYYRSRSSKKDSEYFLRGNIRTVQGLKDYVFDIDHKFSTYYDCEVAQIIGRDLLYEYLNYRIESRKNSEHLSYQKEIPWTDSKNALIELIYALYASRSIGHGKVEIRKIVSLFQMLFGIQLGDVHHAFHRMKFRKNESNFLDKLKASLEAYIEKDL